MSYPTSKSHDNSINTFGFIEGGLLNPPPGPGTPKKQRRNRVKIYLNLQNNLMNVDEFDIQRWNKM